MTPVKTKKGAPDQAAVVTALRSLLEPFADSVHETKNGFGGWSLETGHVEIRVSATRHHGERRRR